MEEFLSNVQEMSVPHPLLIFIDMVLYGPSVKCHSKPEVEGMKSAALFVAQLLMHNAVKKTPS